MTCELHDDIDDDLAQDRSVPCDSHSTRLGRAQSALDQLENEGKGRVALYTWRTGRDVAEEALGIIKTALEEDRKR